MVAQLVHTPGPEDGLRFVAVSRDNYRAVLELKTAGHQRGFVQTNAESIVLGHYHPSAWFRAVYEGQTPVGFVLLHDPRCQDPTSAPFYPEYSPPDDGLFVWRLMIGEAHQGLGFGRQVIALLMELARENGFRRLYLSYFEGESGPAPFYERCGFVPTGRVLNGEIEAYFDLA